MSAYLATNIIIRDPEKFSEYGQKAKPTIVAHGGEPVLIGQVTGTLVGSAHHQFEAIFRFPDRKTVEAWYNSEDYQALIPLRNEGADVTFKILEDYYS